MLFEILKKRQVIMLWLETSSPKTVCVCQCVCSYPNLEICDHENHKARYEQLFLSFSKNQTSCEIILSSFGICKSEYSAKTKANNDTGA